MKHYDAILAKAEELGMPQYFRDDLLVHDKDTLSEWPENKPFVWSVRPSGTHTICVQDELALNWGKACFNYESGDKEVRWFIWTGQDLVESTPDEWRVAIERQYLQLPKFAVRVRYTGQWIRPYELVSEVKTVNEQAAKSLVEWRLTHRPINQNHQGVVLNVGKVGV